MSFSTQFYNSKSELLSDVMLAISDVIKCFEYNDNVEYDKNIHDFEDEVAYSESELLNYNSGAFLKFCENCLHRKNCNDD